MGALSPLGEVWTLFYMLWSPQQKFEWSDEFIRRGNSNFCQPDGSIAKSGVYIIKMWRYAMYHGCFLSA